MEPLGQGGCSPRPCQGFRVKPSQPDLEAFQRLPPQGLRVAGRWGCHLGAERAISLPQTQVQPALPLGTDTWWGREGAEKSPKEGDPGWDLK